MNFIGIDISLNSTAIALQKGEDIKILSFTNKKENNLYIKELESCGVNFFFHQRESSDDYSKNEVFKILHWNNLVKIITQEILKTIDINEKTICQIEGYSFSKNTSSILDIVAFSTLIRSKLIESIPYIDIKIISPSTLKLEACKICYTPINVGKKKPKYEWRNNEGISGGSFKKPHMFKAMIEGNIQSPILPMLKTYSHLQDRDKIPNPIEDIIDAIFALKIASIRNDSL